MAFWVAYSGVLWFFRKYPIWTEQFLKHPGCYFAAAFNSMYGYFYIGQPEFCVLSFATTNLTPKTSNICHGDILVTNLPKLENSRVF